MSEEAKRCEICGHFLDKHQPGDRKVELESWLYKETKHPPYKAQVHPVAHRLRLSVLRANSEEEIQVRKAAYQKELRRLKRKEK